jgi:hypothetical protein
VTTAWYRSLLAVGLVGIFFTNFANYGLRFGLEPLYWIAVFGALAAPLALSDLVRSGLRIEPLGLWAFAYLLLSLVWFVPSSQSALALQQVETRLLTAAFLVLALFLFSDGRARRAARRAIVPATLLAVVLNLYEVVFPMTFSDIPGRASGLFANVNQSGAALVLGLILGREALLPRFRFLYALVVGLGLLATVSRAAILGWILVLAVDAVRRGQRLRTLGAATAVGLAAVLLLLSPWWAGVEQGLEERGVLTANVRERFDVFAGGGLDDASTLARRQVAALAWDSFAERPVDGAGTGASTEGIFELGPHNMYLAMMVDHGVIGLFLLPTLILAAVWGADLGRAYVVVPFALFLAFWGFFSHNVLEERYILLAIAFVGAEVAEFRGGDSATGVAR